MAKKNYDELSEQILKLVGGKKNIGYFTHCITRLRFNVRDKSLVNADELEKINSVLGTQWSGEQLQVIIGQDVEKLYSVICRDAELAEEAAIDEILDKTLDENNKFSIKKIGDKVISYLSGSMTGIIPVLIAAAMCKTIGSLLGPGMFKIISDSSDLYVMFDMLFDAFFYFLPIFLGYSAAKVLKTDTLLGIYMGTMIIVPKFVAMIGVRDTFSIFGISVPVINYGQTFLPVMLGVWLMSYVYKFIKKYIPDIVTLWLTPLLTILVMTPVMFAVCAPLGSYVGELISSVFMYMGGSNDVVRIIGSGLLGIAYPYLTLFGMHSTAYMAAYVTYFELGYESFLMPMGYVFGWVIIGTALGAVIKYKKKENKSLALSYFASSILGGITEPALYGICLKNKSAMKVLLISCGIGGLLSGIIQAGVYVPVMGTIFTSTVIWTGGAAANIIKGVVLEAICFAAGLLGTIFLTKFGED